MAWNDVAREVKGTIFFRSSSGGLYPENTQRPDGNLASFTIERSTPEGKLFGFAVSHKLTVELVGNFNYSLAIMEPVLSFEGLIPTSPDDSNVINFPWFFIESKEYDEASNKTTIIGHDIIHQLDKYTMKDIEGIEYPLTAKEFMGVIINDLGLDVTIPDDVLDYNFDTANGLVNVGDTTIIRDVFEDYAEVTNSICYCDGGKHIVFNNTWNKSNYLTDVFGTESYFKYQDKSLRTITGVTSATELGDNIRHPDGGRIDFEVVFWNNVFLDLKPDRGVQVVNIYNDLVKSGNTIKFRPYNLEWRGDGLWQYFWPYRITTTNGYTRDLFPYNHKITYNGGLKAECSWSDGETVNVNSTPSNLGEAIKNTFAKVDRVANEITLYSSEISDMKEQVAQVKLDQDSINLSVENTLKDVEELSEKVEMAVTSENLTITVEQIIQNMDVDMTVDEVITKTGFVFDADGLTVSKEGVGLSTQITEDGMTIRRDEQEKLVINHSGVIATDLTAKTFLTIGDYSRFQNALLKDDAYGVYKRTGCYWLGGAAE